jgi:type VI secretion system protein ImpK
MNATTTLLAVNRAADDDRTVVVSAHGPQAPHRSDLGSLSFDLVGNGLNPLLDAATALLNLATRVRGLPDHPDVDGLRLLVINEIKSFEQTIDARDYDRATVLAARYCLCSMVDEAVLGTEWGNGGAWSAQSLLSHFHNETWGGEKVYLILARVLQEPARHREMIELLYVCLRLGFRGKYAVVDNGEAKLDVLMDNVYDVLRRLRGEVPEALADVAPPQTRRPRRLARWVSIPTVIMLSAASLIGLFLWLDTRMAETLDPVRQLLTAIGGSTQ